MTSGSGTERSAGAQAVLVSVTTLMVGFGLVASVLGVRGTEEFSAPVVGLAGSVHYLGFLVGAFLVPRLVASVGHIRVYAALASAAAVSVLVFPFAVNAPTWVTTRLGFGLCISGMYIVAESWLSAVSTNQTRGRLLAVYLVTANVGVAVGQWVFSATGATSALPFAIGSALMSLSLIPLSLSRSPAPALPPPMARPPVREVLRVAPLGPATSIVSGIGVSLAMGIGPTYGVVSGFSVDRIAVLMAVAMIGGVVLQWPVGAASDRLSRRRVILVISLAATAMAVAGAFVRADSVAVLVVFGAFTALSFPLYSLAISHVNDEIDPQLRVPASAVLVMSYGIGSVIGPVVGGVAIQRIGPVSFWWLLAASTGLLAPYAVHRVLRRPHPGFGPERGAPLMKHRPDADESLHGAGAAVDHLDGPQR